MEMKRFLWFVCSSHTAAEHVTCPRVDLEKWLTHSAVLLMCPAVQLPNIERWAWGILHFSYVFHFLSTDTLLLLDKDWKNKFFFPFSQSGSKAYLKKKKKNKTYEASTKDLCFNIFGPLIKCKLYRKKGKKNALTILKITEQKSTLFPCKNKMFGLRASTHCRVLKTWLSEPETQHVNSMTRSCTPKERLLFQRGQVLGSPALKDWLDSGQKSFLAALAGK